MIATANVPESKALNMLLAANEVAVNAFEHAGGPEALRVGVVDGRFVCEISDRGPGSIAKLLTSGDTWKIG